MHRLGRSIDHLLAVLDSPLRNWHMTDGWQDVRIQA